MTIAALGTYQVAAPTALAENLLAARAVTREAFTSPFSIDPVTSQLVDYIKTLQPAHVGIFHHRVVIDQSFSATAVPQKLAALADDISTSFYTYIGAAHEQNHDLTALTIQGYAASIANYLLAGSKSYGDNDYWTREAAQIEFATQVAEGKKEFYYIDFRDIAQSTLSDILKANPAYFQGATLHGVKLSGVDLRNANLRNAKLNYSILNHTDLRGADLRNADLDSADLWSADLREANLKDAILSETWLTNASMTGATLSGVVCFKANLSGADLTGANLTGADLEGAQLIGADLTDANLKGANLSDVDFTYANLTNADLTGANMLELDLSDAIIAGVKGLGLDKR